MASRLFEANSYYTVLVHILEMFKHICRLSSGEISFSDFKQLTTLRYSDFIVSKDHVLAGESRCGHTAT